VAADVIFLSRGGSNSTPSNSLAGFEGPLQGGGKGGEGEEKRCKGWGKHPLKYISGYGLAHVF